MKFHTILMDPPWAYKSQRTGGSMTSGSIQKYPVMSTEEICAMPVRSIAEKDSMLFLWATVPLLDEAFVVMKALGWKYKTSIVWEKTGRLGLGYWFRGNVEVCLYGIRGHIKPFRSTSKNIFQAPARIHSEKPDEFFNLIEPHVLRPAVELFSRRRRDGWSSWGNQIESDITLDVKPASRPVQKLSRIAGLWD